MKKWSKILWKIVGFFLIMSLIMVLSFLVTQYGGTGTRLGAVDSNAAKAMLYAAITFASFAAVSAWGSIILRVCSHKSDKK